MKLITKDNFNYDKILGVDFWIIKDEKFLSKIKKIIKAFLVSLLKSYYTNAHENSNTNFLFIKTQDRKDYNKLYEDIFNECEADKINLTFNTKYRINTYFIVNFFIKVKLFFRFLKKYSLLDSLFLYIKILNYYSALELITTVKYKNLVVFSDVQPIENMIVQYSNMSGIETTTLQHGLYVDYNDMPNINMLNYIDVSSRYLLSWGKSTEDLFKKNNPDIVVEVCGKPLNNNPIISTSRQDNIGVVFDIPLFKDYNKKLLSIAYEIASKKNMKVIVRMHPQDYEENYIFNQKLTDNEGEIRESNFIIGHTTSMIYEYLALGHKVYKLRSDIPSNALSDELKFETVEELEKKISKKIDFLNESKNHIKYIDEQSRERYRTFFEKFSGV